MKPCQSTGDACADSRGSSPASLDATIIVVSFNTRELTLDCLSSIYNETTRLSFEVIVVDNASSDGSAESIRRAHPTADLITLDNNVGFAGANNIAADCAKGKYLILLNPDTVVLHRAIEQIVGFAETHPESGIIGGRTLFPDGTLNPTSCWAAPSLWSLFCEASGLRTILPGSSIFDPESMGNWKRDSVRTVDIVSGCFMLLSRRHWDALGGFDTSYFMYGEDADLNHRARRLGIPSTVTPDATIVHRGGASEPVREDKLVRLLSAQCQLIRCHWSPRRAAMALGLKAVGTCLRASACRVFGALHATNSTNRPATWESVWRRRAEWLSSEPPRGGKSPPVR